MMRTTVQTTGRTPRRLHRFRPWMWPFVAVFFRYSYSRDAYILRLVGRHVGPVVRPR